MTVRGHQKHNNNGSAPLTNRSPYSFQNIAIDVPTALTAHTAAQHLIIALTLSQSLFALLLGGLPALKLLG